MRTIQEILSQKKGMRRYIGPKRLSFLASLLLVCYYVWHLFDIGVISTETIYQLKGQNEALVFLVFVVTYVISVFATIPCLPLNLLAGFLWGGVLGGFAAALSVTLGGWMSFFIARVCFGQPLASDFDNKWIQIVRQGFSKNGWKFVAFARVNPIMPTGPLNYLLALTDLSHTTFLACTFVFILPPSIAVAFLGEIFQTFSSANVDVSEILWYVAIFSVLVTVIVSLKYFFGIFNERSNIK